MSAAPRLDAVLAQFPAEQTQLLPICHAVQAAFGCADAAAEAAIADHLNLSRAEVHGVVSFYQDFAAEPNERPWIELCRAEACQARGVEALVATAQDAAGKRVRIKTVYCLGLCSAGPAARTVDRLHARLDAERLADLVKSL